MADEERVEEPEEEKEGQQQAEAAPGAPQQPVTAPGQVRLNFDGVTPQYANFCTLTVRQGEVFMSFGKTFLPTNELKVDSQIVMSLRNVGQLHQAMTRLLEQAQALPDQAT